MSRTYKDRPWEIKMIEAVTKNPRSYYIHNHHNVGRVIHDYSYAEIDGIKIEPRAFCTVHAPSRMAEYEKFLHENKIQYVVIADYFFFFLYSAKKDVPCEKNCESLVLVRTYVEKIRHKYADYCTAEENHVGWSAIKEDGLLAPCTVSPAGPLSNRHYGVYDHGNGYCHDAGKIEHHERSRARDIAKNIVKAYNTRGEIEDSEFDELTYEKHEYCYC